MYKNKNFPTARQVGLIRCHGCGKLVVYQQIAEDDQLYCPRCSSAIMERKPHSISYTWALLITSLILYIPANTMPIMSVEQIGQVQMHTISSGIVELMNYGMYPIALLVFVASILVPLLKMVGLMILLVSVQRHWQIKAHQRTALYRVICLVGRWSMLDIFMISILVALVSMGKLANIEACAGATAFAGVVVFTMLAANSFDSRLIWDSLQ